MDVIDATPVEPLLQTPPIAASRSGAVFPKQTCVTPVIAGGRAMTLTIVEAMHPVPKV